ncbi:hypothetical protein [Blastochloris tepida]|uniref:Uncharacterized protein n=1 Tax=Blastochloris tepida TaxID=2233851 RepID=A0A348FXP0_9HYPH|nr:hypothetical protein [Blastochloris tepida]BBF92073.1 hypothetical protein BLTE_07580 [Blastochloris tepida]
MTVSSEAAAAYLWGHLASAELVGSSSANGRLPVVCELVTRSYSAAIPWRQILPVQQEIRDQTSVSAEQAPLWALERIEDPLLAQLHELRDLDEGWDGEEAAKPTDDAIREASYFARLLGGAASDAEVTLHVDGSVILDFGDAGSVRFKGDGQAIYAFEGFGHGIVPFDGFIVPREIRVALES